jgi:hypothetical protein
MLFVREYERLETIRLGHTPPKSPPPPKPARPAGGHP